MERKKKKKKNKWGSLEGEVLFWNVSFFNVLWRLPLKSNRGKPPFYATWGDIAIYPLIARPIDRFLLVLDLVQAILKLWPIQIPRYMMVLAMIDACKFMELLCSLASFIISNASSLHVFLWTITLGWSIEPIKLIFT